MPRANAVDLEDRPRPGLGGLSLPRKSVVWLTDRPDMTVDVYCGCKTTMQQHATDLDQ